jgi:xanthine dehydrogenase YagS FAD-binding subunit
MTVRTHGELLTDSIPSTWAGAKFTSRRSAIERRDFRLLNVASSTHSGQTIEHPMVVNAAARPLRLHAVEAAVVGKPRNEQTAELAGQIAIQGAQPLGHNGYKIPLMRNLVKRAIRGGGGAVTS